MVYWGYTKELFIICAPDTDVTETSHGDRSWTAGHKNQQNKTKNNLSF